MSWIIQNIGSICVLLVVAAFVFALVYSLVRSKKKGGSSCAGCAGCAMAGKCHGACSCTPENDAQQS